MAHAGTSANWTLKSIKTEVESLIKAEIDTNPKYPHDLIAALALVHREIGAFLGAPSEGVIPGASTMAEGEGLPGGSEAT